MSDDATLIRARHRDGRTQVKVLMSHPMESGHRKDEGGQTLPAWFIREVEVRCRDRLVLKARWGPSVSRNPYLEFTLRGFEVGDRIVVRWLDNRGRQREDGALIQALT